MKIALQQVQQNIADIANRNEYTADIIYELLAGYGRAKSAITQLREGHLNKAEDPNAVLQKDVVYFRTFASGTPLESEVEVLYEDPLTQRYKPRYLIATDLTDLAAKDMIKNTTLTIKLADIDDHLDFFYAWTGDEVVDTKTEARADRRAADKMNELYVEIEKTNRQEFIDNPNFRHELNVFFTRLLFCYFAEDTGIYEDKQFTNAIKTYTQTDGSDLTWFFGELFNALDTKPEDNSALKTPFKEFPFVNGSIFNTSKHAIAIPEFSTQARHLILECGRQNWGEINPDIFGVIFQGVVDPEHRDENGMDYTSVPNIMKVIQPLFLDDLDEEYDKYFDNEKKLWSLLGRVQKIKVFDPACGSGNFLIIAYKELRKLQHKIIARIDQLRPAGLMGGLPDSQLINIHNFYGIEIDDFAHELAVLSLFLAKHQMNQEFAQQFGKSLSIIPLIDIPTIVRGNATRLDWHTVCSNVGQTATPSEQSLLFEVAGDQTELQIDTPAYDEIYLIGNPPYKGSKLQSASHRKDFSLYFNDESYSGDLDYISIWFIKGARYIKGTRAKLAFVSTNSICQGQHVSILFPKIIDKSIEIGFAYTSFKWQNSARDNAGVTVIIVSLRPVSSRQKYIFEPRGVRRIASNINGYLIDADNIYIDKRKTPLSRTLQIRKGNQPTDGGNLILSQEEYAELVNQYPESQKLIKKLIGAREFLHGINRYCLWLVDISSTEYEHIPFILERINKNKNYRLNEGKASDTIELAKHPELFRETNNPDNFLVIPSTTSERRDYVPIDYKDGSTIATNACLIAPGATLVDFSLIGSRMHMAWMRAVAGRLKTDYRYSKDVVYNNFPLSHLDYSQEQALKLSARRILIARANHPDKTLAEMYDPDIMPKSLRDAHTENDHLVDQLYKKGGFMNDEDRLAALFALYEQMTAKEKTK